MDVPAGGARRRCAVCGRFLWKSETGRGKRGAPGGAAHQHFPVHFVPVLSEEIVNQSLSFCLFHCGNRRRWMQGPVRRPRSMRPCTDNAWAAARLHVGDERLVLLLQARDPLLAVARPRFHLRKEKVTLPPVTDRPSPSLNSRRISLDQVNICARWRSSAAPSEEVFS